MRHPVVKLALLIIGVTCVAAILVPVAVTMIENRQARLNAETLRSAIPRRPSASAIVVVFSRSGNTAVLARHVAEQKNADLVIIEAPAYKLGLKGWLNAMQDARGETAAIEPERIDLGGYETVYLCSPIWLYSPAPPIWQFVANHRLDGKAVILVNTYNSQFKQDFIDAFEAKAISQGALSFDHRFVQRGRMGQQISTEEMLRRFSTENGEGTDS